MVIILNLYYPIKYQITRSEDTRFAWRMFAWQKSQKCSIHLYTKYGGGGGDDTDTEIEEQIKIPRHWRVYFKLAKHATDKILFQKVVENMCVKEYDDLYEIKAHFECIDRDMRKKILFNNYTIQCPSSSSSSS